MKNLGKVKIFAFAVLLAFGAVNAKANSEGEGIECDLSAEECAELFIQQSRQSSAGCDEDCVMDKVVEHLQNQVKQLVDESDVCYTAHTLLSENKKFSGKKYGFALVEAKEDFDEKAPKNTHEQKAHCAAVINYSPNKPDVNAICSYGINEKARIYFKGAYFTIGFEINDFRHRNVYKNYTTYKFIDDDFYLYQYSREYFKAGDKKGQFVLDKTDIFYRQPRDDKSKSVLIPISVANQQFMDNLVKQCYKNGKCKE